MTIAEWLATRSIVLDPATVHANWRGRNDVDVCLDAHDRCVANECGEKCSGQLPFPSVEPDGLVIDRWGPCPKLKRKMQAVREAKLLKRAQLPQALCGKRFEDFTTGPGTVDAYEAAIACANGNATAQGLLLAGSPGTGKTHLAAAVLSARLRAGRAVIFATVPELIEDLRAVQRDQVKLEDFHRLLTQTELLVLDDLGAERGTDFSAEQLFLIVNARLNHRRQLVATTNHQTPADLAKRLGPGGERIVSRLAELCAWHVLEGPDARQRPKSGAGAQQVLLP